MDIDALFQVWPVTFATPAYDEAVALRDAVLRRPLGLHFFPKELAEEYDDQHFACYEARSGRMVGCLVLRHIDDNKLKMRQVAVLDAYQKKGIGQLLVADAEAFARDNQHPEIVLHARETAVPFYEKLQYHILGERFLEVGIPHFKMAKHISP
jgi:predicted GNAT family N-acyltransferase